MVEKSTPYVLKIKHRCLIMANQLFSESSMKRTYMKPNFENNTISIFNENIPLITINSGHYAIHNTKAKQIINNIDRETSTQILLLVVENQDN